MVRQVPGARSTISASSPRRRHISPRPFRTYQTSSTVRWTTAPEVLARTELEVREAPAGDREQDADVAAVGRRRGGSGRKTAGVPGQGGHGARLADAVGGRGCRGPGASGAVRT